MNRKTLVLKPWPRRDFLKGIGTVLAGPMIVPASAIGADGKTPPSERVTMGFIGVGGRGTAVMKAFLLNDDVRALAVCDPFLERRDSAKKLVEEYYEFNGEKQSYRGCTAYNDFRELLERDDIVDIATQDSWHVPIAIAAAKAGKDIQIEKPLGLCVSEQRTLCDVINRQKTVFQFGTQQRHGWTFKLAVDLVRTEKIGSLRRIEVGSPAGQALEQPPVIPVPKGFDYEMWLGPAPKKPYTEKRCITPWWWFISDYTFSGFVAGWGVHHIDIAQWGADADRSGPVEIEGSGVFPQSGLCDTATAWDLNLKYDNGIEMRFADNQKCEQGVRFIGTEGWVSVNRTKIDANPKTLLGSKASEAEWAIPYVPQAGLRNFLDCVKSRRPALCDIETAHRSTSVCHLSQIALLLKRKLNWDPKRERFVNDDEANTLLDRSMRAPWMI